MVNLSILPSVVTGNTICQEQLALCSQRISNYTAHCVNEVYAKTGAQFQNLIIAMAIFSIAFFAIRFLKKFGYLPEKQYVEWLEGITLSLSIVGLTFVGMVVLA